MLFLNTTETIGVLIGTATTTTTGSIFLTLFIMVLVLFAMALMFGVPFEYAGILIIPYFIACMAFYSDFVAVGLAFFIYLALVFTQKFIFK